MIKLNPAHALVLLSGGQDSTTCLAWALNRYDVVETVGFDYQQRHKVELKQRLIIIDKLKEDEGELLPSANAALGEDHLLPIEVLNKISETALTRDVEVVLGENNLPTSFVPGRNLLFLTLAGAVAYRRGLGTIVAGMCETDYSGYPDCRDNTLRAMGIALNLGLEAQFHLELPLMWLNKAATWKMAEEEGGGPFVELVKEETHTCYKGDRTHRHAWGWGCGTCPACEIRAKGFQEFEAHSAKADA